jgi:DNA-binding CsgD family transcriptional regulator
MEQKLTIKEKQIIAAKANGVLRTNSTIDKIQDAVELLLKNNEKITNKRIAEITGLSLATVKRNKLKEKTDPMSFNNYDTNSNTIENTLPTITEEDFWGNEN